MSIESVAILSPGDMGHAIGRLLKEHELRVLTCLTGRSNRTKELSEQAGIIDVPNLNDLVEQTDILLSVTVSEAVPGLCRDISDAVKATGTDLLFAECNAIAPALSKEMEGVLNESGARYVDASIIGGPPRNGSSPRLYASGDNVAELEQLREFGLDVRNLGPQLGRASGIKMCYAALTKGKWTLQTAVLLTAEQLGLSEVLCEEFAHSQPGDLKLMRQRVPRLPADSQRWIGEMEEIAATFADAGVPPGFHEGAAEVFRLLSKTPFASETRETIDANRSMEQSIKVYAEQLPKPARTT